MDVRDKQNTKERCGESHLQWRGRHNLFLLIGFVVVVTVVLAAAPRAWWRLMRHRKLLMHASYRRELLRFAFPLWRIIEGHDFFMFDIFLLSWSVLNKFRHVRVFEEFL